MRGAPPLYVVICISSGIIPADAGSTCGDYGRSDRREDHPRGCGEHSDHGTGNSATRGSSPRMRGARSMTIYVSTPLGIIPADAGSTIRRFPGLCAKGDHPRGCGEHPRSMPLTISATGSSPRMRGAPLDLIGEHTPAGIIPADAGSTSYISLVMMAQTDHPRGCGEHYDIRGQHVYLQGSSPRMRGAQGAVQSE